MHLVFASFPDYTTLLSEIVRALNRPTFPTWVVALISASVGGSLAVAAQLLRRIFDEQRDVRNMRRVLYVDVAREFVILVHWLQANSETRKKFSSHVKRLVCHRGHAFAEKKPDMYLQIREYFDFDLLYTTLRYAHDAMDKDDEGACYDALASFAKYISGDKISHVRLHDFKRYLSSNFDEFKGCIESVAQDAAR